MRLVEKVKNSGGIQNRALVKKNTSFAEVIKSTPKISQINQLKKEIQKDLIEKGKGGVEGFSTG